MCLTDRRVRNVNFKLIFVIVVILSTIIYLKFFTIIYNKIKRLQRDTTNDAYYESYLTEYEGRIIGCLGSNGQPAQLEDEEDIKKSKETFKRFGLNAVLSDRMPLDRRLKDLRNPVCQKRIHINLSLKASVIVIFCNELLSVILRTIWSVILRTPKHLLKEIVLIDDGSTDADLNGLLQYYIDTRLNDYDNIKLITLKSRQGLIKARLEGARAATGDALVFLDAHCEATIGWIEPLLQRIEEDHTAVVMPIIDNIMGDTLAYSSNGYNYNLGGFSWTGDFTWIRIQNVEDSYQLRPIKSPTMPGGLFAIHAKYFWDMGSYDEQMNGWGGENLEMSFRIWQCGGRVEFVPCSRVGHLFRDTTPYGKPSDEDTHAVNTARMAEVWMDDYKRIFYLNRPDMLGDPSIGDLTQRKQLRQRLGCKSFRWYLDNIYPEKFIPDENIYGYGQVRNKANRCLDDLRLPVGRTGPLGTYRCHPTLEKTQFFSLTLKGQLRTEASCAQVFNKSYVRLARCKSQNRDQLWKAYDSGVIYHPASKKCLTIQGVVYDKHVIVMKCNSPLQKWSFTYVNKTALIK